MKRIATLLFGALLFTTYATPAPACQWPPVVCPATSGTSCDPLPLNACDTLWIDNTQRSTLVPFAATGDTVRGVGGIFTAIDSITTGFGFYLQRSAPPGTPWTGVDVFTGGTNRAGGMGLRLGDSVVVYGKTAEFNGGTEILSFNASFATPNIIVRKVSSDNPVPLFHTGTVHELNFLPVHSPTTEAEQWEGSLVRIATSMRVVRHIGIGTNSVPGANCLVVDNILCPPSSTSACDSVLVETSTLAGINAPPVGSFIASVRGIFDQRNYAGQLSYIIQIRKPSDMDTNDPPHVVDAYCVSNDTVRVVFDKAVTAVTANDPFNYSYTSGTVVNAAILEADNQSVNLAISPFPPSGATDEIKITGIEAAGSLVTMTAVEARNYVQGIQTIYTIQGPSPDSLLLIPCEDVARFLGNNNGGSGNTSPNNLVRLSYRGVCIGGAGNVFYVEAPAGGHRSGLAVFAPPVAMITGHQYLIASSIQEFPAQALGISESEMLGVVYMRDEGAPGAPAATLQSIKQVNGVVSLTKLDPLLDKCTSPLAPATAEDYEGVLVRINNSKIGYRNPNSAVPRAPGAGFHISGPYPTDQDTIFVHATNQGLTYAATDGHIVDVIGIMHLNFGAWEIYPRSNADVIETSALTVGDVIPRTISFSVAPNPAKVARFSFGLPREDRVELAVFDVTGRQVAMIEKSRMAAGSYSRFWDGRTDGGGSAGAGLYFYRLRVGNDVRTIHGVRLR